MPTTIEIVNAAKKAYKQIVEVTQDAIRNEKPLTEKAFGIQLSPKQPLLEAIYALTKTHSITVIDTEEIFNKDNTVKNLYNAISNCRGFIQDILTGDISAGQFKAYQDKFNNYIDNFITLLKLFDEKSDKLNEEEISLIIQAYKYLQAFSEFVYTHLRDAFSKISQSFNVSPFKTLQGNCEDARVFYGNFLYVIGRYNEARKQLEKSCLHEDSDSARQEILGYINSVTAKTTNKISIPNKKAHKGKQEEEEDSNATRHHKLQRIIDAKQKKKEKRKKADVKSNFKFHTTISS